ncbi:MAG: MBL fold metallo-hydrolase [Actinobacteria bacterium]|nr:MBL fold metallo-hydrolase [Actinomycetota bacterium]
MRIQWFGQGAFLLTCDDGERIAIDPFGDVGALFKRRFYPAVPELEADLLLVTHEHPDHNAVERVTAGQTIRSTAGRFETSLGDVVGIASEHDATAGTERGANVIYRFELDGLKVAHFGDFGQPALRPEQRAALGDVDVLMLPIGGGPTIGGEPAVRLAEEVGANVVVPMHYRTEAIDFLDPPDEFLAACEDWEVERVERNEASVNVSDRRVLLLTPPS